MTHPSHDTSLVAFTEEIPPEPEPNLGTSSIGDLFPSHMDFVPELLFPPVNNQSIFGEIELTDAFDIDTYSCDLDASDAAFDHNLEQIRFGLRAAFNRAAISRLPSGLENEANEPSFDEVAVSTLLSPDHVRVLAAAYFRTTVPDFAVTHEASFSFEDSCPELILAIMLSGSLRCAPHDYVLAARRLMRLGVDFIFSRMNEVQHDLVNNSTMASPSTSRPLPLPRNIIETVAAALIADSAMATVNDADEGHPRSQLPSERLYQLSSIIRACGLTKARRSAPLDVHADWGRFIYEESCIR